MTAKECAAGKAENRYSILSAGRNEPGIKESVLRTCLTGDY